MSEQDPNLPAMVVMAAGDAKVYEMAIARLAGLIVAMGRRRDCARGGPRVDILELAGAIAEAELAMASVAHLVRVHTGTDATMDGARSSARVRLIDRVTRWRVCRRWE